ncbi:hypothetical protein SAMN04487962_12538 [Marinobacter segnicrescens]|uniref:Uncharacterized protein n=1 Tax=Marinobacter segnicrescens TaxID=430453 RepID=A0A1I0H8N5_9GAMM|nr:hypothetical protein [Marinobacter segnicrescens]SET80075.1 hypothetical protein SAMN04487962_12538 [Marinobacter segnicrescens]
MKIESENQSVEVIPKKGRGGRPRKDPSEKRLPALMLRLNIKEQKKLQRLIKESGWPGDPSSFVRDLIMSEKPSSIDVSALSALEHYLTILNAYLTELEEDMDEDSEQFAEIKSVISQAAQAIYNNK